MAHGAEVVDVATDYCKRAVAQCCYISRRLKWTDDVAYRQPVY